MVRWAFAFSHKLLNTGDVQEKLGLFGVLEQRRVLTTTYATSRAKSSFFDSKTNYEDI